MATGTGADSIASRTRALTTRTPAVSPVARLDSSSNRPGTRPLVRPTTSAYASVVTMNPSGTRIPAIRESSARFAPLPPAATSSVAPTCWNPNTYSVTRTLLSSQRLTPYANFHNLQKISVDRIGASGDLEGRVRGGHTDDIGLFTEQFAAVLAEAGMPRLPARVFAALL